MPTPERLARDLGERFELDPVELDVLADREVGDAARVTLGRCPWRA